MLAEREAYLARMLTVGYKRKVCVERACTLLHCVRLLRPRVDGLVGEEEIVQAARSWADEAVPGMPRVKRESVFKAATRSWCRFLQIYAPKPEPGGQFPFELREFSVTMVHELGYLPATTASCGPAVQHFLEWVSHRTERLSAITQIDVDEFLQEKRVAGWSHRTCTNEVRSLRAFFRYAEARGWSAENLSRTLRTPVSTVRATEAKGPPWHQVRRMIQALDPTNPSHCRARAILLLASVYALRRSELARLTLDDFDWPNAVMTVRRSKRGRVQQFPLTNEVGEAIIRYLREVRPLSHHRQVFLKLHAPLRPATNLGPAMRQVINSQGVFDREWCLHSLRHSCATELLRKGTSLRGIADFLGHRGLQSVSIYARCDIRSLRRVGHFDLSGVL